MPQPTTPTKGGEEDEADNEDDEYKYKEEVGANTAEKPKEL